MKRGWIYHMQGSKWGTTLCGLSFPKNTIIVFKQYDKRINCKRCLKSLPNAPNDNSKFKRDLKT